MALTARTNTTLSLTSLQTNNTGNYVLMATNLLGSTNTDGLTIKVLPTPAAPTPGIEKYANMVATNSPWAFWRLNETTDPNINDNPGAPVVKAYDYSGHGFLGTYGNKMSVGNVGPSSLTPGFPGFTTLELAAGTENTVDQGYLTLPNLNLAGKSNITFMAWINPTYQPGGSAGLLFNRGGPDGACGFGFANGGADLGYTWNNNSAATYNYDSGLAVAVGVWNFVAYVVTPTNTTMYLGNLNNNTTNFSQATLVINNVAQTWSGGTVRLGNDQNNSVTRSFPGLITEAALFTNALSTAQIQQFFTTAIGATGLAPQIASTKVTPSDAAGNGIYSGQNAVLTASVSGTAPLGIQWQASPDQLTWTNVPGGTNAILVLNPLLADLTAPAYFYYQLTATNSLAAVTNSVVLVTYNPLPATPPGLWTVNFQYTNNINGTGQGVPGGVGSYIGRGILGNGMFWNPVPDIRTSGTVYNGMNSTSVSSLADDGATQLGVNCLFNNGGAYNGIGTLASRYDPMNLMDQWFRGYGEQFFDQYNYTVQLTSVPDGTYNVACYGGSGITSQGSQDLGSTFIVVDPVNGNQTNVTACPSPVSSLQQGVNFVVFTHVHAKGGSLNVSVTTNMETADSWGTVSAVQLQLVSYDPLVANLSGSLTNAYVGQAVTFTNTSTGFVTNSVWTFGDGSSVTNLSNASVLHSYAAVGTYSVGLTVSGPGGSPSSVTKANYIVTVTTPKTGTVKLSGGVFKMTGTNGLPGTQYRILTTTNLLSGWTPVFTNLFAPDGSYGYTNSAATNAGGYFRLVTP